MDVIARAKKHFGAIGVQKLEVTEWEDEDGKPTVIHYKPVTLDERQKFRSAAERDGDVVAYAEVIVAKALNADGSKMFNIADKRALRKEVDPDVIRHVALLMMLVPSVEEMGKD